MNIKEYFDKLKDIRNCFLELLNNEDNKDENYATFIDLLSKQKVQEDKDYLQEILYLIQNISNNYYRTPFFYNIIERILLHLKNDINNNFTNFEIFRIFEENKRVLLILFDTHILIPDSTIASIMLSKKHKLKNYQFYFFNELSQFLDDQERQKSLQIIEPYGTNFDNLRKIGENDNYLTQLIRQDSVTDFIQYVTKKSIPLDSKINDSIFETNSLLMSKKAPTLIKYAAFFGSVQIFKFLSLSKVDLETSLWLYLIHSHQPELIHYLEENQIKPSQNIVCESIRCHYDDMTNYIFNCLSSEISKEKVYFECFKDRNYAFLQDDISADFAFYSFCKYDYLKAIKICLNSTNPNVNALIIRKPIIVSYFSFLFKNEISIN